MSKIVWDLSERHGRESRPPFGVITHGDRGLAVQLLFLASLPEGEPGFYHALGIAKSSREDVGQRALARLRESDAYRVYVSVEHELSATLADLQLAESDFELAESAQSNERRRLILSGEGGLAPRLQALDDQLTEARSARDRHARAVDTLRPIRDERRAAVMTELKQYIADAQREVKSNREERFVEALGDFCHRNADAVEALTRLHLERREALRALASEDAMAQLLDHALSREVSERVLGEVS